MRDKNILLGITGGIAACKAPALISLFTRRGGRVKAVVTAHALQFVTRPTLETLTGQPVYERLFDGGRPADPEHISLAEWADAAVIAPATANIIGKTAHGIADDLLSTVITALRCPILMAPAMNTAMYTNPAVRANLETLRRRGTRFIGPAAGRLACGSTGPGRMSEPAEIAAALEALLNVPSVPQDLAGRNVLVTAGRTEEPIDPVWVLSNRSSGKMGYALAAAAAARGARVTLVSGRADIAPPEGVKVVYAATVKKMRAAVLKHFRVSDMVVMAAAVSDFTVTPAAAKMKKGGMPVIPFRPAPDILKELGEKKGDQVLVGFALETDNGPANARKKLKEKNLDLIVLNSPAAGLGTDTNRVTLIAARAAARELSEMPKTEAAHRILAAAARKLTGAPESENK